MSDWTDLRDGVSWKSRPLFNFDISRSSIVSRFGPAHMVDLDSNGVGLFDAWFFRWLFHDRYDGEFVRPVHGDDALRNAEVRATDCERSHILFHLGLGVETLHLWVPDNSYVGEPVWSVLRQDDNGNVATVASVASRCEADSVAHDFEARSHKQTYWVQGPQSA